MTTLSEQQWNSSGCFGELYCSLSIANYKLLFKNPTFLNVLKAKSFSKMWSCYFQVWRMLSFSTGMKTFNLYRELRSILNSLISQGSCPPVMYPLLFFWTKFLWRLQLFCAALSPVSTCLYKLFCCDEYFHEYVPLQFWSSFCIPLKFILHGSVRANFIRVPRQS